MALIFAVPLILYIFELEPNPPTQEIYKYSSQLNSIIHTQTREKEGSICRHQNLSLSASNLIRKRGQYSKEERYSHRAVNKYDCPNIYITGNLFLLWHRRGNLFYHPISIALDHILPIQNVEHHHVLILIKPTKNPNDWIHVIHI